MPKYSFPVQFTFTLDMAAEGRTAEDAAEKLEKKLESGSHGIRSVEVTFSGWKKLNIISELEYKHVPKKKGRKLPEETARLPRPVIVKPKEPEIEKIWPNWYYYPISKLGLSTRARNGLQYSYNPKIEKLGDLVRVSEYALSRIRNIGENSRKEIIGSLEKHGLHLEMRETEIREAAVTFQAP